MITEEINLSKGRLFAVGDIHGMFNLLQKTLDIIGFDEKNDILVSIGDIVDRGDESEQFQQYLQKKYFNAVIGNHEYWMLNAVLTPRMGSIIDWGENGGNWGLTLPVTFDMLKEVIQLPIALTVNFKGKKIGFVHAGVPTELDDWNDLISKLEDGSKIQKYNCLFERARARQAMNLKSSKIKNIDLVVGGHTIQKQVFMDKNSLFIDTGAFHLSSKYEETENRDEFGLTVVEILLDEDGDLAIDPYQYDSELYLEEIKKKGPERALANEVCEEGLIS